MMPFLYNFDLFYEYIKKWGHIQFEDKKFKTLNKIEFAT